MKINMAEDEIGLSVGTKVSCKTCNGKEIKGDVAAYDENSKMIVLKMAPSNGVQGLNDVMILNLDLVSDLNIIKPADGPPKPLPSLNIQKISNRLSQKIAEKQRQMSYIGVDVTPEAQKLFNFITRTVKEVVWEDKTIRVLDTVVINPPYNLDSCRSTKHQDSRALDHVRKLVEKYYNEAGCSASAE